MKPTYIPPQPETIALVRPQDLMYRFLRPSSYTKPRETLTIFRFFAFGLVLSATQLLINSSRYVPLVLLDEQDEQDGQDGQDTVVAFAHCL